ncbi:DUF6758 family protein [Planobispora siamensis]|uniref:Phosphotransacetylase n=1 Tax=Planobispora siamensis TaxID=936338 RepID=A0A8J3SF72_9ACTN|nr:DUF6758 family protein [Planobispora siamensis]GIH91405.1 hypothetical protein Psi01_20350 [Planobispora siamensis]
MRASPTCPRCFGPLRPPSAWSSAWRCGPHGDVLPLQPARRPSAAAVEAVVQSARVPVWLPWPLPTGWLVTGFAEAGDERTGTRAAVVALSGPSVTQGPADLLIIAEEPGVGLGAAFAGLDGPDPGDGFGQGPAHAKIEVKGHPAALWCVEGAPDRAVYAGEALGDWLWTIVWPAEAGCLITLTELCLRDLRDDDQALDLPFGAFSPRLGTEGA